MSVCKLERVVRKSQMFLSAAELEGFELMEELEVILHYCRIYIL